MHYQKEVKINLTYTTVFISCEHKKLPRVNWSRYGPPAKLVAVTNVICDCFLTSGFCYFILSWLSYGFREKLDFLFSRSKLTSTLVITTPAINPPM